MVRRSLWSFGIILNIFFISSNLVKIIHALDNPKQILRESLNNSEFSNNTEKNERSIFVYRKNGVRLDIRLVRGVNDSIDEQTHDRFPMPPIRDLGHCAIDLSVVCMKNRISRYIDKLGGLEKITLFGSMIKLVKVRELQKEVVTRRGMYSVDAINRSINDFFDKFALRIILPGWNKRKEHSQIDFMFDDKELMEGRGKGHHKNKGGDDLKQMMMCMMIGLKMNIMGMMGLAMFKGMMMSGISMLMTKMMLIMKLMEWMGGSSSSGKVEKIVLVTKTSGDDSSGWHGPPSHSSYGPPSSSGGGHNSGGWGRSFNQPLPMKSIFNSHSQTNNQGQLDNVSIVNTYPESNRDNYSRSIHNHEHVGEVYQLGDIRRDQNHSHMDNKDNRKLVDVENKL